MANKKGCRKVKAFTKTVNANLFEAIWSGHAAFAVMDVDQAPSVKDLITLVPLPSDDDESARRITAEISFVMVMGANAIVGLKVDRCLSSGQ